MQTLSMNANMNPKNEHDYHQMFASQLNDHNMITTCHVRHIFMPIDKIIKKIYLMQLFVECNNSIPSNQIWLLQAK